MSARGESAWIIEACPKVGTPAWKPLNDSKTRSLADCQLELHQLSDTRGARPLLFRIKNVTTDPILNWPIGSSWPPRTTLERMGLTWKASQERSSSKPSAPPRLLDSGSERAMLWRGLGIA